jgi:uncharacterized membrane protein HdeD (DUF308 family)
MSVFSQTPFFGTPASGVTLAEDRRVAAALMRLHARLCLVGAAVAAAVGAAVLGWPRATLTVVGVLFGVYLLVTGALQLLLGGLARAWGGFPLLALLSGALSVALGLLCLGSGATSVVLLAWWVGIGWMMRGTMLAAGVERPRWGRSRAGEVATGVLMALSGVVLLAAPIGSVAALVLVTGCWRWPWPRPPTPSCC